METSYLGKEKVTMEEKVRVKVRRDRIEKVNNIIMNIGVKPKMLIIY